MNRHAKPSYRRFWIGFSLFLSCGLSACNNSASEPVSEPPLAGADIGGEFELINSAQETVRWSDFTGQYRVVYFGYAFCPDVCPNDVSKMIRGLNSLQENAADKYAKIVPIFITIDPERDTPDVIAQFTSAFSDDLIGLTGTTEQVQGAIDAFRVYAARGEDLGGGQYLMDHSNIVYLFGPEGEPLATLPVNEGADAIAAEIEKWVS